MKIRISAIAGVLLVIISSSQMLLAQTNTQDYVWTDGFLEKQYSATPDAIKNALDGIFGKCVVSVTTADGTTTSYGVGDKNGKWLPGGGATWHGVGTINELDIKDGGLNITVKKVTDKNMITVGFKVGDGDKKISEMLHQLLASKLGADKTSEKKSTITQPSAPEASNGSKTEFDNLKGLKVERLDESTVRITEGFDYQRAMQLGSQQVIRIKEIIGGIIIPDEGSVTIPGATTAVGIKWVFTKADMTLNRGGFNYTSAVKDASIEFTTQGVVLKSFKIEKAP